MNHALGLERIKLIWVIGMIVVALFVVAIFARPVGLADDQRVAALGFVGVAVLAVSLIVMVPGEHVIHCGVDTHGRPYAKVLIMNLVGRYHNSNWTGVDFSYDGGKTIDSSAGFERPAHRITTTVVHADRLPRHQSGRTVSCSTWKNY